MLVWQTLFVADFVELGFLVLALPTRAREYPLWLGGLPEEVLEKVGERKVDDGLEEVVEQVLALGPVGARALLEQADYLLDLGGRRETLVLQLVLEHLVQLLAARQELVD